MDHILFPTKLTSPPRNLAMKDVAILFLYNSYFAANPVVLHSSAW